MKQLDKIASQYLLINEQIKALETQKEELKVQLMAFDGEQTESFKIAVSEYQQERVKGLNIIKEVSPNTYQALVDNDLLVEVTCSRLNVKPVIKKVG